MSLAFGSLFSGIGGIDAGLEACGLRVAFQCEVDPFRRDVLAKRYPHVPTIDDVRAITEERTCDVLAGGSPCQDLAAHGSGAGLDGDRSGLWWEFVRVIRLCSPGIVFFENVANVLRSRDGSDFASILTALARLGFDAVWGVFRADLAGLSHRRRRLFLLAYTNEGRLSLDRSTHDDHGGEPFGDDAHGCDAVRASPPGPADIPALQAWSELHGGALPGVRRDLAGVPDRVDRVAALGDTAPPALVALAWRTLRECVLTGSTATSTPTAGVA